MTISNKKKVKIRRLMSWRKGRGGCMNCSMCGKKITRTIHHFLCNKCWNKRHGGIR